MKLNYISSYNILWDKKRNGISCSLHDLITVHSADSVHGLSWHNVWNPVRDQTPLHEIKELIKELI